MAKFACFDIHRAVSYLWFIILGIYFIGMFIWMCLPINSNGVTGTTYYISHLFGIENGPIFWVIVVVTTIYIIGYFANKSREGYWTLAYFTACWFFITSWWWTLMGHVYSEDTSLTQSAAAYAQPNVHFLMGTPGLWKLFLAIECMGFCWIVFYWFDSLVLLFQRKLFGALCSPPADKLMWLFYVLALALWTVFCLNGAIVCFNFDYCTNNYADTLNSFIFYWPLFFLLIFTARRLEMLAAGVLPSHGFSGLCAVIALIFSLTAVPYVAMSWGGLFSPSGGHCFADSSQKECPGLIAQAVEFTLVTVFCLLLSLKFFGEWKATGGTASSATARLLFIVSAGLILGWTVWYCFINVHDVWVQLISGYGRGFSLTWVAATVIDMFCCYMALHYTADQPQSQPAQQQQPPTDAAAQQPQQQAPPADAPAVSLTAYSFSVAFLLVSLFVMFEPLLFPLLTIRQYAFAAHPAAYTAAQWILFWIHIAFWVAFFVLYVCFTILAFKLVSQNGGLCGIKAHINWSSVSASFPSLAKLTWWALWLAFCIIVLLYALWASTLYVEHMQGEWPDYIAETADVRQYLPFFFALLWICFYADAAENEDGGRDSWVWTVVGATTAFLCCCYKFIQHIFLHRMLYAYSSMGSHLDCYYAVTRDRPMNDVCRLSIVASALELVLTIVFMFIAALYLLRLWPVVKAGFSTVSAATAQLATVEPGTAPPKAADAPPPAAQQITAQLR